MTDKPDAEEGVLHKAAEKLKEAAGRREPAGAEQEGNFEHIQSAQTAERG